MDHDTATLLNAFRSGDQEAFAILYVRHQALVRAVCARAAAPGEVDDCLQAVFLVLSRRPAAAAAAPSLEAWLVRVSWHVARCSRRDWRRRQVREGVCATPAVSETTPDSEALEHLEAGLQRLPERQRQAVLLQFFGGQSPEAIATSLGVTRNHAYQLTHRGLEGLRRFLAQRGFPVTAAVLAAWFTPPAQAQEIAVTGLVRLQQPSPLISHLAQGAQRMLDLSRLLPPIAAAAALVPLMAVGLWTAEATPSTPSTVDLHVTDLPATALVDQMAAQLHTTVRWDDRVDRHALPHVTLAWDRLSASEALAQVAKTVGLRARQEGAGWVLEPLPVVTPPQPAPPEATAPISDQDRAVWESLDQRVTLDFVDHDLRDVCEFLRRVTHVRVESTPAVIALGDAPVTLMVEKVRLRNVLHLICDMHQLTYRVHDGILTIDVRPPGSVRAPQGRTLDDLMTNPRDDEERAMAAKLASRATAAFEDQSFEDVLTFLRQVSGLNVVPIGPHPSKVAKKVTFTFKDTPIATLLTTAARQVGWTVFVQHEAICLDTAGPQAR